MSNLATQTAQFGITILNGPDKGATYQLVAGRITIGRGSDNDIIIKDDTKISRNHAAIKISAQGVEISDISDKNKLFVNNKQVSSAFLSHGNVIQIGETKLMFNMIKEDTYLDLVLPGDKKPARQRPSSLAGAMPSENRPRSRSKTRKSGGLSTNFYILLAVIILGAYFLLNSKPKSVTDQLIRPTAEVNKAIEDRKKQIDELQQQLEDQKKSKIGYEDAQTNYIRGFRDYQKGRYDRAIEYFSACENVLPQCSRYKDLSKTKFDDLINSQMNYGRKYLDQGQFKACASTFKNVMYMIKNRSAPDYKEAEQNAAYCIRMGGDRL